MNTTMSDNSRKNKDTPITECTRCGTCCKKGGPSFHLEDRELIEKGDIPARLLYTIRKGEPAYDNIKVTYAPSETDIIKIKGKGNKQICVFFDEQQNACTIYDKRPVECRTLECWDTHAIETLYSKNRLTRKDLLENIEGLWGVVMDHQSQCSYGKISPLVKNLTADAKTEILKIIQYDSNLRTLLIEKGQDPGMNDFLFGRPLIETVRMFGLRVKRDGNNYSLVAIQSPF